MVTTKPDSKQPPNLAELPPTLFRVDPRYGKYPALSIPNFKKILRHFVDEYTEELWDKAQDEIGEGMRAETPRFENACRYLRQQSIETLAKHFSVPELAAIYFSHICTIPSEKEHEIEAHIVPLITHKVELSSHHQCGKLDWNQIATAYEAIRAFTLDLPDFTYHLDASVGCNARGYSRFTRTFLDGELAILIYYKGKHAITVSFDIVGSYKRPHSRPKAQLKQIQLKEAKGNRFLFYLKPNYVEAITAAFTKAFAAFDVLLIHGENAADTIIRNLESEIHCYTRLSNPSEKSIEEMKQLESKKNDVATNVAPRLRRIYNQPFRLLCRRTRRHKGYSRIQLRTPTCTCK